MTRFTRSLYKNYQNQCMTIMILMTYKGTVQILPEAEPRTLHWYFDA